MSQDVKLRDVVRGLILDPDHRVLLVRFEWPDETVWATPGGGLEDNEDSGTALRRELAEETGLVDAPVGPAIWTRTHVFDMGDLPFDGQRETIYLVRTFPFTPRPGWSWEELRGEGVTDVRWWTSFEVQESTELFSPRRLPELLSDLIRNGPPPKPIDVGV